MINQETQTLVPITPPTPIVSPSVHKHRAAIVLLWWWWWWGSIPHHQRAAAPLPDFTRLPVTSAGRKGRGWRWHSPLVDSPLPQIGLPPPVSVGPPVKRHRSINPTSVVLVIIFGKIQPVSATQWMIMLMEPAFIPRRRRRRRNPCPNVSRIISSLPASRRGSITTATTIHVPSRRTIRQGDMKGPRYGWERRRMTSPRTPSRCITWFLAVVTVLSPSKVQIVTQRIRAYPVAFSWTYVWIISRHNFPSK